MIRHPSPFRAEADLFKMLGDPVRVRVLELLCEGPKQSAELLAGVPAGRSALAGQLAVLRQSGIIASARSGSAVVHSLTADGIPGLMNGAVRILAAILSGRRALLTDLMEAEGG